MFSEEVLARLSQLNRERLPAVTAAEQVAKTAVAPAEGPAVERVLATESLLERATGNEDVSQLPSGTEVTNAWGTHWLRRRRLNEIWPHGDHWLSHSMVRLDQCRSAPSTRPPDLQALLANLPNDVIYLDLETCGFSGSMVFLVGLIHQCDGQFQLAQLMARNYAEEKAMLQTLWSIAAENRVLATFNGKSFDWPMVHDRSTVHHLGCDMRATEDKNRAGSEPPARKRPPLANIHALTRHDPRPELLHCDLLHASRRRWKKKLRDCKLQTLEQYVCRRHRSDDIPGREIPAAYHDFVRSGDAWLIRGVLHHNALDLITLLQLSMLLLQ